jgi:hypothetical protein
MSEENLELKEFKADGENSSTADPVGTPAKGRNRRADKDQGDTAMPTLKTRAGLVKKIVNVLQKESLESLEKIHDFLNESPEDREQSDAFKKVVLTREDVDVSGAINALLENTDFSDDFKKQLTVVYDTAVMAGINKFVEEQTEATTALLAEEYENIKTEITEKLDGYLDVFIENWMEENKLAVDTGIKTELVSDFIAGFKTLCAEHSINLPEEQDDVIEQLGAKVVELEADLNDAINKSIEMAEEIETYKKNEVFAHVADGLASTETEKFRGIAENVDYTSDEDYAEKLSILKEKYFPTKESTGNQPEVDNKILNEQTDLSEIDFIAKSMSKVLSR